MLPVEGGYGFNIFSDPILEQIIPENELIRAIEQTESISFEIHRIARDQDLAMLGFDRGNEPKMKFNFPSYTMEGGQPVVRIKEFEGQISSITRVTLLAAISFHPHNLPNEFKNYRFTIELS